MLGLNDQVELWKVERLIKGQHAASGGLIRRWGPNRTMVGGQDCTLSPAPKSVSILWALANQELRDEIEVMVGQAASGAMAVMLGEVPLIHERYGPGPNDRRFVKADDYVAVQALHTTARLTEAKPELGPSRHTDEFEGDQYGAGVSYILVDMPPGAGVRLHRHPYPEIFQCH